MRPKNKSRSQSHREKKRVASGRAHTEWQTVIDNLNRLVNVQTDQILTKARAERPCSVCAVLGHTPLEHLESEEILSPENARRFAKVVLEDGGLTNGRAQLLARYILATTPLEDDDGRCWQPCMCPSCWGNAPRREP